MGTVTWNPVWMDVLPHQTGPTVFGGITPSYPVGGDTATAALLADNSDSTGVHFGTTFVNLFQQFFLHYNGTPLPTDSRISWIRVDYRARHQATFGYMWPYQLQAHETPADYLHPHTKFLPCVRAPFGPSLFDYSTITSTAADDGFRWADLPYNTDGRELAVLWGRYGPGDNENPWDPSNYPYLVKTSMVIGYIRKPTVTNIGPTGTVTNPRPNISWGIGNLEETGPSAHQVVILPPGSVDAAGVTLGDAGFNPATGSGVAFNTGKVSDGSTSHSCDKILAPATWWIYVRQWIGTGVDEYASDWAGSLLTVEALTVDSPTIVLADDTASNTVKATIEAGPHVEDLLADTIEVQYYDPVYAGWVPAQIENSMVPGTGTSIFYDGTHAPGEEVSYRVRGVGIDSGVEYASPWVTVVHTVGNLRQWWLRSTIDFSLNRNLNDEDGLLMKSCNVTRARPNAATWGIGSRPATVVHDVTKGDVLECEIWAMSESAYLALRALLEDGDDLMLVNPWGQTWRVQPGSQIKEDIVKASPRSGELTALGFVRTLSVNFIEVGTA